MEDLRKKLFSDSKSAFDRMTAAEKKECAALNEDYKTFLTNGKTERECVSEAIEILEKNGFVPFVRGMKLKAGDKIYRSNRGKALLAAVIGEKNVGNGVNLVAAHIDSPRIDLKPMPIYEDSEIAYMKCCYYGGIKKYQWTVIPLELHGVIVKKNGEKVEIAIGRDPGDPLFTITDLLPHLGKDQLAKSMTDGISAESLNPIVGGMPYEEEEKGSDRVKLTVMKMLNEKYGIIEDDFISAELCFVPNFDARDVGFDRSFIGAYGHDDRVCAYPALRALVDIKTPTKTAMCILADKEEIGSTGVSGMKSACFDTFMHDMCNAFGVAYDECYERSACLSADVNVAFDPNYPEVTEKRNTALVNHGISLTKYTGGRGKGGSSDASAELMWRMRNIMDNAGVVWQIGTLGKVEQGGGGTVACYMADRNIDTVDAGVPVLSMHAPYEVVAKNDVYSSYRANLAFYTEK